jgi:hypothetical protein
MSNFLQIAMRGKAAMLNRPGTLYADLAGLEAVKARLAEQHIPAALMAANTQDFLQARLQPRNRFLTMLVCQLTTCHQRCT